MELYLQDHHIT